VNAWADTPDIPSASALYRAAQGLVKAGQPVFPCRSGGPKVKAPMTKRGLHDATLDLDQIKAWWRAHRTAALGIPTGIVWDVLDVDVKRDVDGRRHLPSLQHLGLLNGCQFVVRTPSGGWHLYFKAAPKGTLSNRASATLGLDVRSHGGYVIAPPSYIDATETDSPYTGAYEYIGDTIGGTEEPLNWDLIVSALAPIDTETKKPISLLGLTEGRNVAHLRHWLSQRQAGERNNALHWAVCRCIENGVDPTELVEVALMLGLDEDEVMLTINSALRRSGVDKSTLKSEAETLFS
jgi:hypothetical protein